MRTLPRALIAIAFAAFGALIAWRGYREGLPWSPHFLGPASGIASLFLCVAALSGFGLIVANVPMYLVTVIVMPLKTIVVVQSIALSVAAVGAIVAVLIAAAVTQHLEEISAGIDAMLRLAFWCGIGLGIFSTGTLAAGIGQDDAATAKSATGGRRLLAAIPSGVALVLLLLGLAGHSVEAVKVTWRGTATVHLATRPPGDSSWCVGHDSGIAVVGAVIAPSDLSIAECRGSYACTQPVSVRARKGDSVRFAIRVGCMVLTEEASITADLDSDRVIIPIKAPGITGSLELTAGPTWIEHVEPARDKSQTLMTAASLGVFVGTGNGAQMPNIRVTITTPKGERAEHCYTSYSQRGCDVAVSEQLRIGDEISFRAEHASPCFVGCELADLTYIVRGEGVVETARNLRDVRTTIQMTIGTPLQSPPVEAVERIQQPTPQPDPETVPTCGIGPVPSAAIDVPWASYACLERDVAVEQWSSCLGWRGYASTKANACPEAQRCCPPRPVTTETAE